MKNPSGKIGFSAVEILVFVLIIVIIAAIAVPRILESKRQAEAANINQPPIQAADEASAVLTLRLIYRANLSFQLTANGKFGTLREISEAGLLDKTFADGFTKSGYKFSESVSSEGFCASAVPFEDRDSRTFAVDQTGAVYASADGVKNVPSCIDGILYQNGATQLR